MISAEKVATRYVNPILPRWFCLTGVVQCERDPMRNFPNAAFSPEAIDAMKRAMELAVSHLPDPVTSAHVTSIAESILRTAGDGERDPATLERMALLELAITPRE